MKLKIRNFPFIKQAGYMECGTTCLAMIFKSYGYYNIRRFLSERAEVNTEGVDLYTLSELGEQLGFETNGYHLKFDQLVEINLPCIAHFDGNHFVVIYRVTNDKIWIADPAIGKMQMRKAEFTKKWNGIILELKPTDSIFKNNDITELVEQQRKKKKKIISDFYLSSIPTSRKYLVQLLTATLLLQIAGLALPFFTQAIVDSVLVNNNVKLLYAILVGIIVVFASQVILLYGRNILLNQFKVSFERNFFSKFFEHFIRLKQSFFDNHKREDFINRFQENLKIRQALNPAILESIIDFLFIIMYLLVLFFYNTLMGFLSLVFISLYMVFVIIFTPKLKNLENKIFAENARTMGQFLDTLLGIKSVRLLGIEKLKFWKWKNQYTKALNKVLETEKVYIGLSTILKTVFLASQAAIYWIGAFLTFSNDLTIGQYIAFITIFTIIINALSRISHLWFLFTELSVSFDRLNDVLLQDSAHKYIVNKKHLSDKFDIEFKNVSFKYRNLEDKYVLSDINLKIKAGTFNGIVGRNGSGKTTLIKLLCNLYDTYEGSIDLNGIELQNIQMSSLRKKIAVIPQEIFLFDGTIKENIMYGNPDATDEEIIEAVVLADLMSFVDDQYLGLNLKVGENGVNLSGGQKLKVAFARLFVANPELIILDEASSSLDIETEKKIMDNLMKRYNDKTIISIAHRLNTISNADQIIVLDEGRIAEKGSHQMLLDKNGIYKKFISTYISF